MRDKFFVDGSDCLISYTKLTCKKIKDIEGYISEEYGEATFKICNITFEDGSQQGVEGEHDYPYIVDYDEKIQKLMDILYAEEINEED